VHASAYQSELYFHSPTPQEAEADDEQSAGAAEVKHALSKQGLKTEYDPAENQHQQSRAGTRGAAAAAKPQRAPPPVTPPTHPPAALV
jgi:hypothetical protein